MSTALFELSGFFGLLCSGCALYCMLRGDTPAVYFLGVFYAGVAAAYFIIACLAVAFA